MSVTSALTNVSMQTALSQRGIDNVCVEVFDSLPSTSEYLCVTAHKANATSGAQSSTLVQPHLCVADWQTNGNGRRGKSWVTDRGNVTFSVLLSMQKPPQQLMGLSLVTGLCVAQSLAHQASLSVQLKWPNDVLVDDKKLCGLLTELVTGASGVTQIVVGVGINYKQPADIEVSDYGAVCLPMLTQCVPARETIISDITARLLDAYALFEEKGWSVFADRWNEFDYLKGRKVRVINAGEETLATAAGVDSNGALLIEHNAHISPVYSGEVSVRLA